MWGFELTLTDDTKVQGVIFADGAVYAHEPIADSYAHMRDLLADQPVKDWRVIGPVLRTQETIERLGQDFSAGLMLTRSEVPA